VATARPPHGVALGTAIGLLVFSDAGSEPLALAMFTLASFSLAALVQEFARGAAAQRALRGGSWGRSLLTVVSRNRRRYGGYIAHAGLVVLFIAVAASSSFQTSRDLRLRPGDSGTVGDYDVTYERATADIDPAENRLTFGAILDVRRDGERVALLAPSRNYYSGTGMAPGAGPVRSFFEGEATSEVGRKTEAGGDLWTAVRPDLRPLDPLIEGADRRLERIARGVPASDPEAAAQLSYVQGLAVRGIADRYLDDPPPADFRVNVNPLVIWIWIGGAIALSGGLIAIWPAPVARRRRVSDVYAARLARELGRA
jgi:cytochrome c-type biogenesis protein CcmF